MPHRRIEADSHYDIAVLQSRAMRRLGGLGIEALPVGQVRFNYFTHRALQGFLGNISTSRRLIRYVQDDLPETVREPLPVKPVEVAIVKHSHSKRHFLSLAVHDAAGALEAERRTIRESMFEPFNIRLPQHAQQDIVILGEVTDRSAPLGALDIDTSDDPIMLSRMELTPHAHEYKIPSTRKAS